MASFRLKFEQGLTTRGIDVTYDLSAKSDAVLVIAGTRFLPDLNRARRRGIRVVQRLDGVNWVQRVKWSGVKYSVRAEFRDFIFSDTFVFTAAGNPEVDIIHNFMGLFGLSFIVN